MKVEKLEKTILLNFGKTLLFSASVIILSLTSCSKRYSDLPAFSAFPIHDAMNQSVGRFKTAYLADQINAYFNGNINAPIAVATFVDIDNLYASSTFGRVLSEQLMSELAMRGYSVIEIRQSDALQYLVDEGEFGLSRDTQAIKPHQEISALVVGTYAVSPVRVYLNARVIDPNSAMVMSVGSVEMEKDKEISRLLRSSRMPSTLERIPVRQIGAHSFPLNQTSNHNYSSNNGFDLNSSAPNSTSPSLPKASGFPSLVEPSLGPTS